MPFIITVASMLYSDTITQVCASRLACPRCHGTGSRLDQRKLGGELKRLRLANGKRQAEVAQRLRIDQSYLSLLETGHRNWLPELVQAYVAACER